MHDDIDLPKTVLTGLDQSVDLILAGHVGSYAQDIARQIGAGLVQGGLVFVGQQQVNPFLGEQLGRRQSDAAGSAADERNAPLDLQIHRDLIDVRKSVGSASVANTAAPAGHACPPVIDGLDPHEQDSQ